MPLLRVSARFALLLMLAQSPVRLLGQMVFNEIAASNGQTIVDDEGDNPDWIELYNAGQTIASLAGFTLSDDPATPGRWAFPDLSVGAGESLLVWCSGKDRTESVVDANSLTLHLDDRFVPGDAEWKYLSSSAERPALPVGWAEVSFDDSEWESGQTPIGFGSLPLKTRVSNGAGAILLRRRFNVVDPRTVPNLFLEVDFDDGFVAYLNGVRVFSQSFRASDEPDFASKARQVNAPGTPKRFDFTDHLSTLQAGENVLAIIALNIPTRRSNPLHDLLIDPRLGFLPPALHTNFSLKREGGETLVLSDAAGTAIDFLTLPPQEKDRTYGRFPDGTGEFAYLLLPTPRTDNDSHTSVSRFPAPTPPTITPPAGLATNSVSVEITVDLPVDDFTIRYTTNGDTPTTGSTLYEGPVEFSRDTVVRAAAFIDGRLATRVATSSYFGLVPEHSTLELPVMAISMNRDDFSYVHESNFGRGREFERPAHLELFTETGEPAAAMGFGLRLHGGAGRGGDASTKKAYRTYFRGIYGGGSFEFPLFPDSPVDKFSRLVLRSNFNDAFRIATERASLIRDQLIRDLLGDLGGVTSHGAWYNLFVNLQYRGIYNVVERMDEDFFRAYFPDDKDWDVIKTGDEVLEGDRQSWDDLAEFVSSNDLRDDAPYEEISTMVDLANFTSYMLVNIWGQNTDWPGNNWYAARPRTEGGRWIFLSWDAEFGIGLSPQGFGHDTFRHVLENQGARTATLLVGLLRNARFREFFLERMDAALDGPLAATNVVASIDRLAGLIAPDMEEELRLVRMPISAWENDIESMRTFARGRGEVIREHILNSGRFNAERPLFLRGDVNGDGRRNLGDAVLLAHFLVGQYETSCEDALDVDDSQEIDLTDVLFLANHLYLSGSPAPSNPFRHCGVDPTSDDIGCEATSEGCEE